MNIWSEIKSILGYPVSTTNFIRIIAAVVVLLSFLGLRRLFTKMLVNFLNHLESRKPSSFGTRIINVIEPPVRYLFIALGLSISLIILSPPASVCIFMNRVIRSMIAFIMFWTIYRSSDIISSIFQKYFRRTQSSIDDILMLFFNSGLRVVVVALAVTVILKEWEYDVAGLLAGLGLGGLAFALAARDTLANLFGSIMIAIDRPFSIGDWIYTPHVEGTVEEIGFRSTRVRTFEQALVTVPNSMMCNDAIKNWSRMGKRRINFNLKLPNEISPEQTRECISRLRQMLENHPDIHPETVMVYFEKYDGINQELLLYFFTQNTDWQKFLEVQEDINFKIIKILQESTGSPDVSAADQVLQEFNDSCTDRSG